MRSDDRLRRCGRRCLRIALAAFVLLLLVLGGAVVLRPDAQFVSAAAAADAAGSIVVRGPSGDSDIVLEDTSSPSPAARGGSIIYFGNANNPSAPGYYAKIVTGLGGTVKGDYGGYIVLATRGGDGRSFTENLVADHNGHLAALQTAFSMSTVSPVSCGALKTCGVASYRFATPFTSPGGVPEPPRCTGLVIQDKTTAEDIWVGGIAAVTASSVSFDYAPISETAGKKNLTLTFACWDDNY